jgi:hypothetical protein
MPLVTISNRTSSTFVVPPPVARSLPQGQSVTLSLNADELMDPALVECITLGAVSLVVNPDPSVPDANEPASRAQIVDLQEASGVPLNGAVTTTDATVTSALLIPVATSTVSTVFVTVAGRNSAGSQGAAYVLSGTFRNDAGTVTQIGTTTALVTHEDNAAWACVLDVSGTNVRVRVTGAAATTITWNAGARALVAPAPVL